MRRAQGTASVPCHVVLTFRHRLRPAASPSLSLLDRRRGGAVFCGDGGQQILGDGLLVTGGLRRRPGPWVLAEASSCVLATLLCALFPADSESSPLSQDPLGLGREDEHRLSRPSPSHAEATEEGTQAGNKDMVFGGLDRRR